MMDCSESGSMIEICGRLDKSNIEGAIFRSLRIF